MITVHLEKQNRGCEGELMIYLHIPFCVRKCKYCDFLSGAYSAETRMAYLRALRREIAGRSEEMKGRTVTSIFFGGGTPSVLEGKEIAELLDLIRTTVKVDRDAEITMECNPGTVDNQKLKDYRLAGVNRLSIGLQSPNNEELKLLGRIHSWQEFLDTYKAAIAVGFENINVDLMSALPGQTVESWKETLNKVLDLQPALNHLSVYSLIMEEGTQFYQMLEQGVFQGKYALPEEEEDREMYHLTEEILKGAGLLQYEISNYAKPGYECRHNIGYWIRRDYLGFGLGAASLMGDMRYTNTEDMGRYIQNSLVGRQEQTVSFEEAMEEFMFLGLRLREGVERQQFLQTFGCSLDDVYGAVIEKNCKDGLLMTDEKGIRLTEKGLDLSNYVMAQFLHEN